MTTDSPSDDEMRYAPISDGMSEHSAPHRSLALSASPRETIHSLLFSMTTAVT